MYVVYVPAVGLLALLLYSSLVLLRKRCNTSMHTDINDTYCSIHTCIYYCVSIPVSKYMYIQEVMVNETTVLCSIVESQAPLVCQAVLHCVDDGSSSSVTVTLTNDVFQYYMISQLCNVTIQVLSSDTSQVLEESVFYNLLLNSTSK